MPTASTAQILGNNESIEAYTSNIYTRRVLSGEFQVSLDICSFKSVIKNRNENTDLLGRIQIVHDQGLMIKDIPFTLAFFLAIL